MTAYPVTFELERPATMSRAHVFLRILILVLASWTVGSGGGLGLVYLGLPAAAAILIAQKDGKPMRLEILPAGSPTVGTALLRIVKAIPSALVLGLLGIVSSLVWLIAAISILFNPERLWNFQSGVVRWEARLLAYLASLVDAYPPFSFDTGPGEPSTATASSVGLGPSVP